MFSSMRRSRFRRFPLFVALASLLLVLTEMACHVSSNNTPFVPKDAGGSVYLWEERVDGGIVYEMDSLFPDPFWQDNVCTGAAMTSGGCCYYPPDVSSPYALAQASAGSITLTNVTTHTQLTVDPYSQAPVNGQYGYFTILFSGADAGWSGGDTLTASAPGDYLPAFSISDVAPGRIDGLVPNWDAPLTIPRTTPFTLTWTPDPHAHDMRLVLRLATADTPSRDHGQIWCQTLDDAGTLTIPTDILANAGAGDTCHFCTLERGNDTVQDGGHNLRVQTLIAGDAGFQATFQ